MTALGNDVCSGIRLHLITRQVKVSQGAVLVWSNLWSKHWKRMNGCMCKQAAFKSSSTKPKCEFQLGHKLIWQAVTILLS